MRIDIGARCFVRWPSPIKERGKSFFSPYIWTGQNSPSLCCNKYLVIFVSIFHLSSCAETRLIRWYLQGCSWRILCPFSHRFADCQRPNNSWSRGSLRSKVQYGQMLKSFFFFKSNLFRTEGKNCILTFWGWFMIFPYSNVVRFQEKKQETRIRI